jgi:site-specific DNA recombinase
LSPELYDDGGFSGGNMDRPGITQLMGEVKAGRIQVIVVYKVDRLTRSLADFAKIVEVLDNAGASFVSVTQSFNTTTSMGRLTLNVLLSFAQFEREVTGERIRDKIAASKRKGMWMGGPVPLGYDVQDRKLVINEAEAATVRHIFQRYLELGSIVTTLTSLDQESIKTKITQSANGAPRGGIAWGRGSLAHFLCNRVYIGATRHKDQHFPGEHAAIVAPDLWNAVEAQLKRNRVHRQNTNRKHNNLLAGLLHDGLGRRMQGSQSNRGSRRYHYYVTNLTDKAVMPGQTWRLPATSLDAIVVDLLLAFLTNASLLHDAASAMAIPDHALPYFVAEGARVAGSVEDNSRAAIGLLRCVDVHDDRLDITLCLDAVLPSSLVTEQPILHQLSTPMARLRRIKDVRLVIGEEATATPGAADPALVRLTASAQSAWIAMLDAGDMPLADIAKTQGYSVEYFIRLLRLATLAPSITQAITEGRQPVALTRQRLAKITNIPIEWAAQRAALGFQ